MGYTVLVQYRSTLIESTQGLNIMTSNALSEGNFFASKNSGKAHKAFYATVDKYDEYNLINVIGLFRGEVDGLKTVMLELHDAKSIKSGDKYKIKNYQDPDIKVSVWYSESMFENGWHVNSGELTIENYDLPNEHIKVTFEFSVTSESGKKAVIKGYADLTDFSENSSLPEDIQKGFKLREARK